MLIIYLTNTESTASGHSYIDGTKRQILIDTERPADIIDIQTDSDRRQEDVVNRQSNSRANQKRTDKTRPAKGLTYTITEVYRDRQTDTRRGQTQGRWQAINRNSNSKDRDEYTDKPKP